MSATFQSLRHFLSFFLQCNGCGEIGLMLEPYKPRHAIAGRTAGYQPATVLMRALDKATGDADINRTVTPARQDIDTGLVSHGKITKRQWMPYQVRHDAFRK